MLCYAFVLCVFTPLFCYTEKFKKSYQNFPKEKSNNPWLVQLPVDVEDTDAEVETLCCFIWSTEQSCSPTVLMMRETEFSITRAYGDFSPACCLILQLIIIKYLHSGNNIAAY